MIRPRSSIAQLLLGALLSFVTLVVGYFIFVQTAWGQAFDNIAYFGHHSVDREALKYDADILGIVRVKTLVIAVAVLAVISLIRLRFIMGAFTILGMAFAIEGAEQLKHHLPRPDLAAAIGAIPGYFKFDTYPSGHTTIGTSIVLSLMLVLPAKWRPWLSGFAGLVSASYGTAVLFAGWHRPSDAIGGILWTGFCLCSAAAIAMALRRQWGQPTPLPKAVLVLNGLLGVVALFFAWCATGWLGPQSPDADAPFLVMTAAIVVSAMTLTTWFGWQMSAEDRPPLANSGFTL